MYNNILMSECLDEINADRSIFGGSWANWRVMGSRKKTMLNVNS